MTKLLKLSSRKNTAFSTNGAGSRGSQPILISLYKAQVQVDQGSSHKIRHNETNRKENRDKPQTYGHSFLNRTPIACALKLRIDKWDLIKLQSFYKAKDTVNRTKQQPTDWEKIFTNPTSNRGLISNIYKELKKVDSREPNNPIFKKMGNRAKQNSQLRNTEWLGST